MIAASFDQRLLATADASNRVSLWNLPERRQWIGPVLTSQGSARIPSAAVSRDGRMLALGRETGVVQLFATDTGAELGRLQAHGDVILHLLFAPDGRTRLAACRDKTVSIWDAASRKRLGTLRGHKNGVFALAFSPDGKTLATGSADGSAKLWDWPARQERATLFAHDAGDFN